MFDVISAKLFEYLHAMDDEACTPSGHCSYAGLVDFSGYKGLKARQYEKVWNDRLAELFTESGYCVSREYYYPNSRMKCDLLICTGETKIWLEVKAVWKSWFSSRTGRIETNTAFYRAYLFGDRHRTHSAVGDIIKLAKLRKEHADYVCLLLIGFDSEAESIDNDIAQLATNLRLRENKWHILGPETWPDRNQPVCRYNCWLLGKKVDQ